MLTNRALQILDILSENNNVPITSKKLAIYLGISERSVKTYIKEVLEYCNKNGMELSSKPGKGFVANFSNQQLEEISLLGKGRNSVYSRKSRIAYILYILLCGWDTYTLSLFAEELFVSKKVISEDLDYISEEIGKYNLSITKIAGQGISLKGNEFDKRKALKEYCVIPMNDKEVEKNSDYRIPYECKSMLANNYGIDNFDVASDVALFIEDTFNLHFTDYSLKMLVSYLTIGFNRIKNENKIIDDILLNQHYYAEAIVEEVVKYCSKKYGIEIDEYEKQYIDILLGSAQIQDGEGVPIARDEDYNQICDAMLSYLSDILNKNFKDNSLLKESICDFIPASFTRTKYGIVITNPFYDDVKEMYSSVFATSFSLAPFYENYCVNDPTEQEISYLALYIGGAIVRTTNSVKAILIGTGGIAAASIVARKIENKVDGIEIVAILASDNEDISQYDYDMILTMSRGKKYEGNVVEISPIISERDIKKIVNCFLDIVTENGFETENIRLFNLIDSENMCIIDKKTTKSKLLKMACDELVNKGAIKEQFYKDVLNREHIAATDIGNGVAIPHGKSENVIYPSVYIIKVKDKIDWGTEDVDIIFLLALNFNEVSTMGSVNLLSENT